MTIIKRALSQTAKTASTGGFTINIPYHNKYLLKNAQQLMFLKNEKIAEEVVNKTKHSYLGASGSPKWAFDACPGDCILARKLLESGARKVRLFEVFKNRVERLNQLKNEFPDQLELVDKLIMDLPTTNYRFSPSVKRDNIIKESFQDVPVHEEWPLKGSNVENSIIFYSALSPNLAREFFTYITYALCNFSTFFMCGPTEFYLIVPQTLVKSLLMKPNGNFKEYTAFNVIVKTMLNIDIIELDLKDDCEGIRMVQLEDKTYTGIGADQFAYYNDKIKNNKDDDPFLLIHVKPNNVAQEYDQEFLFNYFHFVKQSFSKRRTPAIKYFETHFPGTDIELIGLGISYLKILGNLTGDEMFSIFQYLYNTSQYKTSIFAL